MIPTEHEATVAVDAAARALWASVNAQMQLPLPPFDQLSPLEQNHFREDALPLVWAALGALPDRRREGWETGLQAGIGAAGSVPSGSTYAMPENPYPAEVEAKSLAEKYSADPIREDVRDLAITSPVWSGAELLCWREHSPGRVCILPADHIAKEVI